MVELLVVIAIMSILMSLLLPVLKSSRESARRILCMNNMKQISAQVLIYTGDFDGTWPAYSKVYAIPITSNKVYWDNYLNYEYFEDHVWHTQDNPAEVFVCPKDDARYNYQGLIKSYGFNVGIMSNASRKTSKISGLKTPSQTFLLGESNFAARYIIGVSGPLYLRFDHTGSSNMVYADGHVELLRRQPPPITATDTPPWNRE